jgi:hypothetical protein
MVSSRGIGTLQNKGRKYYPSKRLNWHFAESCRLRNRAHSQAYSCGKERCHPCYRPGYGSVSNGPTILPGLSHALVYNWNGDNAGPFSAAAYTSTWAALRKTFPNAEIVAGDVPCLNRLPAFGACMICRVLGLDGLLVRACFPLTSTLLAST